MIFRRLSMHLTILSCKKKPAPGHYHLKRGLGPAKDGPRLDQPRRKAEPEPGTEGVLINCLLGLVPTTALEP